MKKLIGLWCLLNVASLHARKTTMMKRTVPKQQLAHEQPLSKAMINDHRDTVMHAEDGRRSITVINDITDAMLTYTNHWYKPRPSHFVMTVNGREVKNHTSEVELIDNKLRITYECEFKKCGILYHREQRAIVFELPAQEKRAHLTFSWYDVDRISVNAVQRAVLAADALTTATV